MVTSPLVATAADASIGLLAAGLGLRFLLAARRLGGLAVLRLPGIGFVALALAAPFLAPSVLSTGFDLLDAARLLLMVTGFVAIALGYLLQARHGDTPEPGYGMAYQTLLLAALLALAPFVAFAALHPVLEAVDEGVYAFNTLVALAVVVRLVRSPGRAAQRPVVAGGFGLLALSQVVLAAAALEPPGLEYGLAVAAELAMLAGLAAFTLTVVLERREAGRG